MKRFSFRKMGIPEDVKMIPVRSSRFTHIGHSEDYTVFYVRFNKGAEYKYENFSRSKWRDLMDQSSMGVWFQKEIVNKPNQHRCVKLKS